MTPKKQSKRPNQNPTYSTVLERLSDVRPSGSGHVARCPAHDDRNPSLSIGEGSDGRVLLNCFAGCATEAVVAAMGLTMADLAPRTSPPAAPPDSGPKRNRKTWPDLASAAHAAARIAKGTVSAIYPYHLLNGDVSFAVARIELQDGKTYRPFHAQGAVWVAGDPPGSLPLYRLNQISDEPTVIIVEGEKCADLAFELGIPATTSAHGAQCAKKSDWRIMAGKTVVLFPDNDEAGEQYATDAAQQLGQLDPPVDVRRGVLPALPPGGDVVDWVASLRGQGVADSAISLQLEHLVEQAKPWVASPTAGSAGPADSADSADTAPGCSTSGWPAPLPLVDRVDLPRFPLKTAFPSYLHHVRDFVAALAETYQVPVDAVATLILPVMALPLSRRFEVEASPGWREQLALYVLVLLPSGERKSAIMRDLLAPIYAWQREKASGMTISLATFENHEQVTKERLEQARRKAAKTQQDDPEIDKLAVQLAQLQAERPHAPNLIITEGTTEAIARSLVLNDERSLLASAEGDALDVMLGRYSGSPNLGVWLCGHSGDSVDSVRRGREPDRLDHPALQVALCVQPEAAAALLASTQAEGRGLLARFFACIPESKVGYRDLLTPPLPPHLQDQFGTQLQQHLAAPVPRVPQYIRLTADAQQLLLEFRDANEKALRPDGALGGIRSWGCKLPGALLRVAGIYRAFVPNSPLVIDAETLRCALSLEQYLTAHFVGLAAMGGHDVIVDLAQRIDRWLRTEKVSEFSRRDAFNRVKGKARKVEEIDPALAHLVERHRIRPSARPEGPTGPGRAPSPRFQVNPGVFSAPERSAQYPHNPQNPGGEPASAGGAP